MATPSPSPSAASRRYVWGGYVGKQFLKGEHHHLLQNATVHVGIHVSLNEPQLPSTSSRSHVAPNHDATTTMLDCRQGTIFLVVLIRASPHILDTIKLFYLRLIRPQDMVPVINLARLSSANCLQAFLLASFRRGFLLGLRPFKPTCCSLRHMV